MTKTNESFHFVGAPAAHRAGRIPPEEWEEHKAEMIEIFLASNVGEVAVQMRLRHGFDAT